MVSLRHPNGYETNYLHLSRYGRGVRNGRPGVPGSGDRLRGIDRSLHRSAPGLPGQTQRELDQSADHLVAAGQTARGRPPPAVPRTRPRGTRSPRWRRGADGSATVERPADRGAGRRAMPRGSRGRHPGHLAHRSPAPGIAHGQHGHSGRGRAAWWISTANRVRCCTPPEGEVRRLGPADGHADLTAAVAFPVVPRRVGSGSGPRVRRPSDRESAAHRAMASRWCGR